MMNKLRRSAWPMAIGIFPVVLIVTLALATSASASFGIASFGGGATDQDGARVSQAGSHPDVTTTFELNTIGTGLDEQPDGNLRDAVVDLPPGLIGDPQATPTCPSELLVSQLAVGIYVRCPVESQVGTVEIHTAFRGVGVSPGSYPLYNVEAPVGAPARLAFNTAGVIVDLVPRISASTGYVISAASLNTSQTLAVAGASVTLWGVPADSAHDLQRASFGNGSNPGHPVPSSAPRRPFVTTPTECTGSPLTTRLTAVSWAGGTPQSATFDKDFDGFPIINEGCGRLSFSPSMEISPSTRAADAPSGLDVHLASPQRLGNPDALAGAHLRDVTVSLPAGLTVNPGAADGLQACADEELGLGADTPPSCPAASKLGTATITTPLLSQPLDGAVYLRSQRSRDPESGEMFRLALVVRSDERGILVKLPGSLIVDEDTGQITASFKDNPQLPVEDIKLTFKAGSRAALATPADCGDKTISTDMVSWSGRTVTAPSAFSVDCAPGLGGFTPSLQAGTTNSAGGAYSPFALRLTKPDGNAPVNGLQLALPTGLLAQIKGNLGSQVGTVKAFAGPGSNPFVLPGQVYLEGPYGDAPFSLKVVVPAKAGPFDLGDVVVRQKIYVDPIDAHVTVVSDPVPTIVKGVPVRLQRLDVDVDKAGFVVNPTSCAAKTIGGTIGAAGGQSVPITLRFQVDGCSDLPLKPRLALGLSGKGQTTDGKHPAVSAVLSQPAGQANLKRVRVTLPLSLALDPDNAASDDLCSFVEGSKPDPKCPASSVVGKATAVSPILDEPLTGPVFFVKNERKDPKSGRSIKTTPKLVIPLTGENGVKLTLTGTSTVADNKLVTTFDDIPDAQVSSFKMDINGGKKGILVVSGDKADICRSTQVAEQEVDGQNGKQADADVYIQTPSCPLKVLSKKVAKSSVSVRVGGLGAGKVTVSGRGIKKTTKTISKSTVATITAKRTKGTPGKVTVSFDPTRPDKASHVTR